MFLYLGLHRQTLLDALLLTNPFHPIFKSSILSVSEDILPHHPANIVASRHERKICKRELALLVASLLCYEPLLPGPLQPSINDTDNPFRLLLVPLNGAGKLVFVEL